jgi:hypothetical protein
MNIIILGVEKISTQKIDLKKKKKRINNKLFKTKHLIH